jgi:hypothetical protein
VCKPHAAQAGRAEVPFRKGSSTSGLHGNGGFFTSSEPDEAVASRYCGAYGEGTGIGS